MEVTVDILIRTLYAECHRLYISQWFVNTALKGLETFPEDIRGYCLRGKREREKKEFEN